MSTFVLDGYADLEIHQPPSTTLRIRGSLIGETKVRREPVWIWSASSPADRQSSPIGPLHNLYFRQSDHTWLTVHPPPVGTSVLLVPHIPSSDPVPR